MHYCGDYCQIRDTEDNETWKVHGDSGQVLVSKIHTRDGFLYYKRSENNDYKLTPISSTEFLIEDMPTEQTIIFENTPNNMTMKHIINGKLSSKSRKYILGVYNNEKLKKHEGYFYCEELDVEYNIKLLDGEMVILIDDKIMSKLTPIINNVFIIDEWYSSIDFSFDREKNANVFILNSYRAQDLVFMKK